MRGVRWAIVAAMLVTGLQSMRGQGTRGVVALPDAPGFLMTAAAGQAGTPIAAGSIRGEVLDINEGLVPGATVTLMEAGQPDKVAQSGAAGEFRFGELGAGRYRVKIAAAGLRTFQSDEIVLKAGEAYELPKVALAVAGTSTEVDVTVTEREIAAEQIKMEEKQRVLGILPNFYSSYIWNAAPLSAPQKFGLATRSVLDPVAFISAGITAGVQQANNTYPGYGDDAAGFGKRYGAAYGTQAIARMLNSAVMPAIFRQDPRYFYRGTGSVKTRVWYAVTRAVVTRGDNGKSQPNYSRILGNFAAGAIANTYHTADDRGARLTIDNGLLNIAGNAADNIIREFVLKRFTPKVPGYATGKAAAGTAGKP